MMPDRPHHPDIRRTGESGNILFLILIAVALFAALSYAVSESSGVGNVNTNESTMVLASQITQFPVSVNAGVMRMIIGQTDLDALEFNTPSDFATLTNDTIGVFHPAGGNVTYASINPEAMNNAQAGNWHFNGHFEVASIGTSSPGSFDGNDVVAFLPGLRLDVCDQINKNLDIGNAPSAGDNDFYNFALLDWNNAYTLPSTEKVIGTGATSNFVGSPAGCYYVPGANQYVYYHVIVER